MALVPAGVIPLVKGGFDVLIQAGAGAAAGFPDQQYVEKGARIAASRDEVFAADVVLQVRAAGGDPQRAALDHARLRPNQVIIAMCDPLGEPKAVEAYAAAGTSLFALELLPRITRAQSMDVLSSMATVSGYRAVLLGAMALPKMFPMLVTAAGTITPAKVFIVGVGVAGLQAIATARRLGALVSAYDVRPAVKEQVTSLGARFVEMPLDTAAAEGAGGYAQAMDEAFYRKQRELMARVVAQSDLVITTAAVPGQKAPILLTREMVEGMAPGSVVVDLAAERGGNCELTQPGQTVVHQGVTILGPANLPAEVPRDASQMYSRNITTFLLHLAKDGRISMNLDDQIVRDTLLAHGGHVVHPRVCELLGIEPPAVAPQPGEAPQVPVAKAGPSQSDIYDIAKD